MASKARTPEFIEAVRIIRLFLFHCDGAKVSRHQSMGEQLVILKAKEWLEQHGGADGR